MAAEEMGKGGQTQGNFGVELIGNSDGAGMGMRPQRLSDGWPVSEEGMECRRELWDRRRRATMGVILYGNILDCCYL